MEIKIFEIVELLSLITAIICFKDIKRFKLTAFIPLLTVVVITEISASNFHFFGLANNYGIYDIYLIISTPISLYIFDKILSYRNGGRSLYRILSVLLMLFIIINAGFFQGLKQFDTYNTVVIELMMAVISLLAIVKLFLDDDTAIMLNKHPYFWVSGSTVVFSAGALIVTGLQQYILQKKIEYHGVRIHHYIMPALNYLLYSSYAYAFILCRKLTGKPS